MSRIKFGDVVKDVKINIDRLNNPYEFYVAGDHMDSEDLTTHRKGRFATDDVGPAFIRVFKPGQILYGSRRTYLKKIAVADFEGICANTTFVLETKDPLVLEQRLLPFIMLSKDFTTWSIAKSKGSTNPYVLFSDLADFEFELPPLEEQKVLADKLWAAYRLKEAYKKLLVATDEMLKSQFIEMFGGKPINGTIRDLTEQNIASVKRTFDKNDYIEYIDISSIDNTTRTILGTTQYIVKKAPSRAQQCVKKGDILVSMVRPINRNIALITKDMPNLVASTGFCVLRPKEGCREYILSVVLSDAYTEKMCDKASGGLYPAVSNGDVLSYEIHVADDILLRKVSAIIIQADKSKFGDFKSQFIEMFGDSSVVRLEDKIATQSGGTPNTKKLKYYEGGNIPWLSSSEVNQGYIFSTEKFITQEGLDNSSARWIPKDSVLIAMYGATAGRVGLSTIPLTTNQAVCALLPCSSFNPIFLYYAVCQKTPWMISQCRGAAQPNISQGIIRSMELPIPPMAKQMQFVSIAKQADKSKSVIQKALVYLNDIQSDELRKIA